MQTASEALDKGIAAIALDAGGVILLSPERTLAVLRKMKKTREALWDASRQLANRATVGTVKYQQDGTLRDCCKVRTSAGVNRFGPLAYQLVMANITPMWLHSDSSLSAGSSNVWNTMYKLSGLGGVYQRQWLGDLSSSGGEDDTIDTLNISFTAAETGWDLNTNPYENPGSADTTESGFLRFLATQTHMKPEQYGQMWAYRLAAQPPEIAALFAAGSDLKKKIVGEGIVPESALTKLFKDTIELFFDRRYD